MGTICGLECLDVQTNPHHCGACDHDCPYGTCQTGVCQGAQIFGGGAKQLAVTASFLYFIADIGVYRTALDGSGFTNFAEVAAVGLAVVGGNVYVATSASENNYPNRVMKFPESGGNPTTIAMEQHGAISIAVRDGMVYWAAADDKLLMKATTAGVGLTTIATLNDRPTEIAADATNIYWTSVGLTTNSGTERPRPRLGQRILPGQLSDWLAHQGSDRRRDPGPHGDQRAIRGSARAGRYHPVLGEHLRPRKDLDHGRQIHLLAKCAPIAQRARHRRGHDLQRERRRHIPHPEVLSQVREGSPRGRNDAGGDEAAREPFEPGRILRERGISSARLTPGVEPAPIDVVSDHLAEGHKTLWH